MAETEDPEYGRHLYTNSLARWQMMSWIAIGLVFLGLAAAVWFGLPHETRGRHPEPSPTPMLGAAFFGFIGLLLIGLGAKNLMQGAQQKLLFERGVRVIRGNSIRSLAYRDARVRSFIFKRSERVLELYPLDGSEVIRAGVTSSNGAVKSQQFERLKAVVLAGCAGPYGR